MRGWPRGPHEDGQHIMHDLRQPHTFSYQFRLAVAVLFLSAIVERSTALRSRTTYPILCMHLFAPLLV